MSLKKGSLIFCVFCIFLFTGKTYASAVGEKLSFSVGHNNNVVYFIEYKRKDKTNIYSVRKTKAHRTLGARALTRQTYNEIKSDILRLSNTKAKPVVERSARCNEVVRFEFKQKKGDTDKTLCYRHWSNKHQKELLTTIRKLDAFVLNRNPVF